MTLVAKPAVRDALQVDGLMNQHEARASKRLGDQMGATFIFDLCAKGLKDSLELAQREERKCTEVKEDNMSCISRRRDIFGGSKLMDVETTRPIIQSPTPPVAARPTPIGRIPRRACAPKKKNIGGRRAMEERLGT